MIAVGATALATAPIAAVAAYNIFSNRSDNLELRVESDETELKACRADKGALAGLPTLD